MGAVEPFAIFWYVRGERAGRRLVYDHLERAELVRVRGELFTASRSASSGGASPPGMPAQGANSGGG